VTEATFLDALQKFEVVHISTHGINRAFETLPANSALRESSLSETRMEGYPGIVLQATEQARGGKSDGFLQAWEIAGLSNVGAKIVVLSACSAGRRYNESSYFPEFTSALADAGIRSVLAARWKVDEAPTRVAMEKFHAEIKGGTPVSEAWRRTVVKMRSDPSLSHPSNWAAFGIYGDAETMVTR